MIPSFLFLRVIARAVPIVVAAGLMLPITGAYAASPRHGADYAAETAKSKELRAALDDYQDSNYPVALREFKAEAERGNRIAQFDYAMMLLNGEGTDPDLPNALIWLQKAAHAGMSHAQFIYGQLYDSGQVVAPNPKLAHYWFTKAAEQGHVDAEVALATQYMDGRGTPRSYAEAFTWYLKAAKNGDEASQYIVASFYERGGDGVKVDLTTARIWYALAAAQGDPAAAGKYMEISERLKKAGHVDPDDATKPDTPNTNNTL
jgi:TPR repeat protein